MCGANSAYRQFEVNGASGFINIDVGEALEDVYKRLHQAWMGPGHAITSYPVALADLRREVVSLDPALGSGRTLITILTAGTLFRRVHLVPYVARRGSIEALAEAFVRSGDESYRSLDGFLTAWGRVLEEIHRGRLPFGLGDYAILNDRLRALDYPALRHTPTYSAVHRPSYRVIHEVEVAGLVAGLSCPGLDY
jgi:hypothetical protein